MVDLDVGPVDMVNKDRRLYIEIWKYREEIIGYLLFFCGAKTS